MGVFHREAMQNVFSLLQMRQKRCKLREIFGIALSIKLGRISLRRNELDYKGRIIALKGIWSKIDKKVIDLF
jgi:hypothetical protein